MTWQDVSVGRVCVPTMECGYPGTRGQTAVSPVILE